MDGLFCDDHVRKGWRKGGCGLAGYFHIAHKTVFYFLFKDIFDECYSGPCQNGGSCENLLGDYRCNCTSGFTGRQCDIGMYYCISLLAP